jgi:hypothetical protein
VHDLLAEKVQEDTPCKVTSASTHSRAEMGEHFYGLHYRPSSSAGRDCIFVVVDRMNKFSHFLAIPMDYKAIQVVELFFREVF